MAGAEVGGAVVSKDLKETVISLICPVCGKPTPTKIVNYKIVGNQVLEDHSTICLECGRKDYCPTYIKFVERNIARLVGEGRAGISQEGKNWCPVHSHDIDYELANVMKPDCIEKANGCGNCPDVAYLVTTEVTVKKEV